MGVEGLYSYMEANTDLFENIKLQSTKLIIDGSNLLHILAFSNQLDLHHGRDYDGYANIIKKFCEALSQCKIEPYVVFDGGKDCSDKKSETVSKRTQQKIDESHNMSTGGKGEILPLLCSEVLKEVLSSRKVQFVQCMAEADMEIASLANEWNCPVLTSDSDFFIFDLKQGCLPIKDFQWNRVTQCNETSTEYIPARLYSVDRFCAQKNINKEILPLFATVCGNDWANPQAMGSFFTRMNFPVKAGCFQRHQQMDGLLRWLAVFPSLEKALEEVVRITGENVRDLLSSGIMEYKISISNVAQFFVEETPFSNIPEPIRILPGWILRAMANGELSGLLINALVLGRVILGVQVENESWGSSHDVSLPIRKVLYGLLLYGREELQRQHIPEGTLKTLNEFGRTGLALTSNPVTAVRPKLSLQGLNEASKEDRLNVLLDTLGVEHSVLREVPDFLRLPICVTCYWLSQCKPQPRQLHLQALLLGMVYGELLQNGCPEMKTVQERLDKKRVSREKNKLDPTLAQLYNQWQSCIKSSFHLNQLLCCPLFKPTCSQLYSGTLVHGLARKLSQGKTPESLLQGPPVLGKLFCDLQGAVLSSVQPDFFIKKKPSSESVPSSSTMNDGNRYAVLPHEGEEDEGGS